MSFLRHIITLPIIKDITPTIIDPVPITPLKSKTKKEKKEYDIGNDKDEIIQNAINDKPSIIELRKALKRYAEISEEEYYENQ